MNRLVIFGAGGHGRVILDIARKLEKFGSFLFVDPKPTLSKICNVPVLLEQKYKPKKGDCAVIAIGDNLVREQVYLKITAKWPKLKFIALVHPAACIGFEVEIGIGTVVMAGSVINAESKIGEHCVINTSASVDHEAQIDDFATIAPGCTLGGNVSIGRSSFVGLGSNIIQNIKVRENILIGAGSLVIRDLTEPGLYFGAPAKKIKSRFKGKFLS